MRVVVLGGSGNFGSRICRELAGHPGTELIPAGRNPPASPSGPGIRSARLDLASSDFPSALAALYPDLVVHCAGPFQGQDYRVATAALAAGAHYIDLADGRGFVAGFAGELDAAARAAGRLAITGASTLPALSSAVVDHLAPRFQQIHEIQVAIAPAQKAQRGTATLAGVLSYAGKPFKCLRLGRWSDAWGWQGLKRMRFAGVGMRLAAVCDVPDLELFPRRYPGVRTVEFRAALELGIQTIAIALMASLRRAGLPLPLERWAGPVNRAASLLERFGTDRGAMLVSVTGKRHDGFRGSAEWHITAPDNHGPEIPCMAALLMARRLAAGRISVTGAHPCMGFLGLADFEPEFARWGMQTVVEEHAL
ncbi:MAG TPA: saccharopine dehydrogenase NADP-binding domain-containing protein [Burkholderiales bacterium]|nr:saccharopine dehydrogenase NADP-binding domain-containing protein [Burkholderiales bacterium]